SPGRPGGAPGHPTAGIAVAAREALPHEFTAYARAIVDNAATLAAELKGLGYALVTGGTDNHLILMDVTTRGTSGKIAAKALDQAGIVCNSNAVPFDKRSPFDPSGIRIGLAAVTSRGFGATEMKRLAGWVDQVVSNPSDEALQKKIAAEVKDCCAAFPPPGIVISK